MRAAMLCSAWLAAFAATAGWQGSAGVIDGIVLDDSGAPVPAAGVTLRSDSGRALRTAEAEPSGEFAFDSLPAGRFVVEAAQVGYVSRSFGQTSASAGRVVIALAENGRFRARVRLPRFGALSGTITDESGQPVSVAVRLRRWAMHDGVRVLEDGPAIESDRQGHYRFGDLPPGSYLVSALGPDGELRRMTPAFLQQAAAALQQRDQPLPAPEPADTVSYEPVYYPGTVERSRASTVAVDPGSERSNIDIALQLVPTARVAGTVVRAEGGPAAYARVQLTGREDGVMWSYGQTMGDGGFRLAPVPLGSYELLVNGTTRDVTLTDQRPPAVAMRLDPPATLSGRVVFDGASAPPDCRKTPCRPRLVAADRRTSDGDRPVVAGLMDPAGPIVFTDVPPGAYTAALDGSIGAWIMTSATIDGRDMMDLPIEIAPRQALTGLVARFTDRSTELAGSTPVGGLLPGADAVSIVVFPVDRALWMPGARRVRVARPDTTGAYRLTGLPPGEYLLSVTRDFDAGAELDAERLSALAASATRVTVRAAGRP